MAKKTKKTIRRAIKRSRSRSGSRQRSGRKITKKKPVKKKPAKRKIKKTTYKDAVKRLKPRPKRKPKPKPKAKPTRRKAAKRPIRRARQHAKLVAGKKKKRKKAKKKVIKKSKSRSRSGSRQRSGPRVFVGKDPLDQLFESQAKVKLLKLFFRNAENMFEPKEIFKRLRINIVLIKRELKKLEKIGIVNQKKAWLTFGTKTGRIKKLKKTVFYLNHGFHFVKEVRELILKSTIASKDDLVKSVKRIGDIKLLVLAGVFLNDDGAPADLLIVGNRINQRKLNDFLKNLEAEVGKELNCAVMTSKEFDYRYDMYDRFTRDLIEGNSEILIQKINLW